MSLSAVPIGGWPDHSYSYRSVVRPELFSFCCLQVSTKFSHGVPLRRVAWVCLVTRMQAGNNVEYSRVLLLKLARISVYDSARAETCVEGTITIVAQGSRVREADHTT